MPWCPQCDEVFPEGPVCPRCRSPLVEISPSGAEDIHGSLSLPVLKVPRRVRRAFGRASAPSAPPRNLMAFAISVALIAGGFAIGHMSSRGDPAVRFGGAGLSLPTAQGAVVFVGSIPGPGGSASDFSLLRLRLSSGTYESLGRFSSPFAPASGRESTAITAFRSSVAVVFGDGQGHSVVGAFPASRPPVQWLDGTDAAWESADSLLVQNDGIVHRWTFAADGMSTSIVPGSWLRALQAPDGAVLEGHDADGHYLARTTPAGVTRVMDVPQDARTLAVSREGGSVLLEAGGRTQLWDGHTLTPASLDAAYEPLGASFSPDGTRVAVTMRERSMQTAADVLLAVFDATGKLVSSLQKLATSAGDGGCTASPAWEGAQRWLFDAPTDGGSLYAVDLGSSRDPREAGVHNAGCGVAWTA